MRPLLDQHDGTGLPPHDGNINRPSEGMDMAIYPQQPGEVEEGVKSSPAERLLQVFGDVLHHLEINEGPADIIATYSGSLNKIDRGIRRYQENPEEGYDPELGIVAVEVLCRNWGWKHMPSGIHTIEAGTFTLRNRREGLSYVVEVSPKTAPYERPEADIEHGVWTLLELGAHTTNLQLQKSGEVFEAERRTFS